MTTSSRKARPQADSLNTFRTVRFVPDEATQFDLKVFLESIRQELIENIENGLQDMDALQFHLVANITLERTTREGEIQTVHPYFHSDTYVQTTNDDILENLQQAYEKMNKLLDKFLEGDSG